MTAKRKKHRVGVYRAVAGVLSGLILVAFFPTCIILCAVEKKSEIKELFSLSGFSANEPFVNPICVFYDKADHHLYIADAGRGEVGIFDSEGFLVKKIGKKEGLVEPVGIAVDKQGTIYVSDRIMGSVKTFDYLGRPKSQYDIAPAAGEFKVHPGRIALDEAGDLLMLDLSNKRIVVFDDKGAVSDIIGMNKNPQSAVSNPADIALDGKGNIYIADSIGDPLKILNRESDLVGLLRKNQEVPGNFKFAVAVEVDSEERTWVVDSFAHKLVVFDRNRTFDFSFEGGDSDGDRFFFPIDVTLDEEGGRFFVLENAAKRLRAFSY